MPGNLQPLQNRVTIVNADGTPTDYFIRWAQNRQMDIKDAVTAEQVKAFISEALTAAVIDNGLGIQVTGSLSSPPVVISLNAGINDLLDVDTVTTPPTDGQVLTWVEADDLWKPGAGGGGGGGSGALTFISQQILGAAAASVTFSSIPQIYEDLVVVFNGRGTDAGADVAIRVQFNGDAGANYDYQQTFGQGTATVNQQSAQTSIWSVQVPSAGSTSGYAGTAVIDITNYKGTTYRKQMSATGGENRTGTGPRSMLTWGQWNNTAAITSITISPHAGNWEVGTTVSLYARVKNGNSGNDPTLYLIHDQILAANAATYDVTNIPQTYEDLVVVVEARANAGANQYLFVRPNNDSGANYNSYSENRFGITTGTTEAHFGQVEAAAATANCFSNNEGIIFGYSKTNRFKNWQAHGSLYSTTVDERTNGVWRSNVAITSLRFFPGANSFLAGTRIRVYGRKPSIAPTTGSTGSLEIPVTLPNASNFTLLNAGTALVASSPYGMRLTAPSAASNIRFLQYTGGALGSTWVMTMRGKPINRTYGAAYPVCFIARNNTSGRIVISGLFNNTQFLVQRWTSYTAFSANAYGPVSIEGGCDWYQMEKTATDIIFRWSPNGNDWFTYHTEPLATFINAAGGTADQFGIGCMVNGSAGDSMFQSFSVV